MKGSPLVRFLAIVAIMGLMFLPLRRLTSGRAAAAAPVAEHEAAQSSVHLEMTATTGPFEFEVKYLGKTIWKGEAGVKATAQDVHLPFPPEGIDLGLEGSFKGTPLPAAVMLSVTPENGSPLEKTIWGERAGG